MPKETNIDDLPAEDLDTLATAQADWDGVADQETFEEDDEDLDDELIEDALGVDAEDGDDVIDEDDDNPYQDSDEALPDDREERNIARQNDGQSSGE